MKAINVRILLVRNWWRLFLRGLILLCRPTAGAMALLWLFGSYAIIFGVLLLVFAFRLRSLIEVRQKT